MLPQLLEKRFENLILIPFNILHFAFQCPFRLILAHSQIQTQPEQLVSNGFQFQPEKTLDNSVQVRIVRKIPQQIICAICHLFGLFVYTNEVVQIHVARSSNNPLEYLRLFLRFCSFLHHVNCVHLLWTRGPQILRVVEHLATRFRNDVQIGKGPIPKFGCILIPLIFIGAALSSFVILHETPSGQDSPFKVLVDFRSPFFNPTSCNYTLTENENQSILNIVISFLLLYFRLMLSYCTDAIIFTTVLAIYRPVAHFYQSLRQTPILNLGQFSICMIRYGDVCELMDLVNAAFSRLMLTYVLEAFSFYSVYLKELTVFDGKCVYMQCKMGFLFLSFCTVFYLTAEIASLMEKSKFILINTNLVKSNGEKETNLDLIQIRIQLHSHHYGISGNGFFLVNYSFVTTVCSTLLTYFIISVQFQSRES